MQPNFIETVLAIKYTLQTRLSGKAALRPINYIICTLLACASLTHEVLASALTITCPSFLKATQPKKPAPVDLWLLSSYDLTVIIDKSRSMSASDCQNSIDQASDQEESFTQSPISRWQWCQQQTRLLTKTTQDILPNGFKIVLFSKDVVEYNNVNSNALSEIFSSNVPAGPTHAERALQSQLNQYFLRKSSLGDKTKPLLIVFITDGCPDDPVAFERSVIQATQSMDRPDEISILMLQVGNDAKAAKLAKRLTNADGGSTNDKAKFTIVTTKSFDELKTNGLTRTLAETIATAHGAHSQVPEFAPQVLTP
jgi:hypothetical protein